MMAETVNKEFVLYVVDQMQLIGPVYVKRMFGGHGIFLDKLMFALIFDHSLYLKADKESQAEFKNRKLAAFSYMKKGKLCYIAYFQASEEVLEDSDEMILWANKAYGAALRAANNKGSKSGLLAK